jgi:hypothetical protein
VHVEVAQRLADAATVLHGPGELSRCPAGPSWCPRVFDADALRGRAGAGVNAQAAEDHAPTVARARYAGGVRQRGQPEGETFN